MPSQKGFSLPVIILSVIFLVLIGIAIFFLNRNFDISIGLDHFIIIKKFKLGGYYKTKAEFQEFTHPSKGFTFEYPLNWRIKYQVGDISGHAIDFYLCSDDYCSNPNLGNKIMNVTIIDSPLEVVKTSYPDAVEIMISDKKGLKDGNIILVPLGSKGSSVAKLEFTDPKDSDHIISTIKFSSQASLDDPGSWPVYEDKISGFSFPYPPIFRVDKYQDESGAQGVRLFYDNPSAAGISPIVPPNIVLDAKVIPINEDASLYADKIRSQLLSNNNFSDYIIFAPITYPIGDKMSYKVDIKPKNNSNEETILYQFSNINDKVIEIRADYINTKDLMLNNFNVMQYIVYKFKFQ